MMEVEILVQDLYRKLDIVLEETHESKILDDAGAFLLNRIRTRFLSELDTEGRPWEPSKAAIRRRSKTKGGRRGGGGTLFDTGTLFHSIQLAPINFGDVETSIRTDVPYGKYHQYGTDKLPKREFLGVSQADANLYEKILALRITRAILS